MQQALGNGHSPAETHISSQDSLFETVLRIDRDLNDLIGAFALLGVKRCSQCTQFFRCADPGALFECEQVVCYGCIPDWWPSVSTRLGVSDRERIEGKLASWLRKYHQAEVIKAAPGSVPDVSSAEFQIVAKCLECAGSGRLMQGERCRFCNGLGSVRIVVPR